MNSQQILVTLCVLGTIILSVNIFAPKDETKEGFWNNIQFTPRTMLTAYNPKTNTNRALRGTLINADYGHDFITVPSFQSVLAPRFDNNNYGALIRYNMPDQKNMAAPVDPLTYGGAVSQENYVPQCNSVGGNETPNQGMDMNMMNVNMESTPDTTYSGRSDSLPVGNMTSVSAAGDPSQEIVYERYMFANTKSRSYGNADYIRGDLAIAPKYSGWFDVTPTISRDLNPGALAVMGGGLHQPVYSLINADSGGAITTMGGVNLAGIDMTPKYNLGLSDSISSVNVSAFP